MTLDTKSLLNSITSATSYLRRKVQPFYDQITFTTGQTVYPVLTAALGDFFSRNKKLPLSGQEIFAIYDIKAYIQKLFNTTALQVDLLLLVQQSYLEILVSSKQMLKISLWEILSFNIADTIGATPAIANVNERLIQSNKRLIKPIIFTQSSNVQINLVVPSALAAADLNAVKLDFDFDGILSDVLDPAFTYVQSSGNDLFEDIAYTLYDTLPIPSANATTFNPFTDGNKAATLFSQVLPLSQDQRFEIQAIELLFGCNNTDQTETLQLVYNNRKHNQFQININNTVFAQMDCKDMISLIAAYPGLPFNDNAGTPVTTNSVNYEVLRQKKILDIPIILPATGNVTVQILQPGSSLNVNQNMSVLLYGRLMRSRN